MTETLHPPVRQKPERKLNWWVEAITDAWFNATIVWENQREEVAIGYDTEMKEFELHNPKPRLRDFMVHMARGEETA